MSTTLTEAPPETSSAPAPVEPDLASMLYDTTASAHEATGETVSSPTPAEEPGTSVTPSAASTDSTTAAATASPVGTETPEKPAEEKSDKGHAAAARRLGSEVAGLKREMQAIAEENATLKAKLDGTYQEPVGPTPEEVEARAEFKGRETASRAVAEGLYGAEVVHAQIYDDASPYKTLVQAQPWLHARVAKSAQPTVEAMRVLKEQEFYATYGSDVTQWVAKIEATLKPKLLAELTAQSLTPVTGKHAPSVTEARGSGGAAKEKTLTELFYGKPAAS